MTVQPSLWPHIQVTQPPPQKAAMPLNANHVRLLRWADRRVDSTDDEIEEAGAMMLNTVRPRRLELMTAGLLEYSGATRQTRTGHSARCWRITTAGRKALEEMK